MPPPGFTTISATHDVVNVLRRIHREVTAIGTRNLPKDVVPPEYLDKPTITVTMVLMMALLDFERKLKKKKR